MGGRDNAKCRRGSQRLASRWGSDGRGGKGGNGEGECGKEDEGQFDEGVGDGYVRELDP